MRTLILGGDGMLGHRLLQYLGARHDVAVTLRQGLDFYAHHGLFDQDNSYPYVDVRDTDKLLAVVSHFEPEVIINAVGLIKQRPEAADALSALELNAVLPHRLRLLAKTTGSRLIHISTDCVFSGEDGDYTEADVADAHDMYGRAKLLGEVREAPTVTLRTSIIGLELVHRQSLVEWFLSQSGEIRGFTRAIYSGLTTAEFSRVIELVMTEFPDLSGLWHVASEPISKHELLSKLAGYLGRTDIEIKPDSSVAIDRSLSASAFRGATGYKPPSWGEMLYELSGEIRNERGDRGYEAQ